MSHDSGLGGLQSSDATPNACGYCKSDDSVELYSASDMEEKRYAIRHCNKCGAYFLAPRPAADELRRAYDDLYYGPGDEKFGGAIEKVLDLFRRRRARMVARYAGGRGRALDVGCGNGRFLQFMTEAGEFEIHGIEPDGGSARRAATVPGIHLSAGPLEEEPFEAESFDAVTLFHVFEHLVEPAASLQTISRVLKPGGVLVMSFPNIASRQARWFKGDWQHLDPPRHLFFFAPADFKREMAAHGFEVVREKHFSMEYNPFGMQQSILNRLLAKRDVLFESLKGNRAYAAEYAGWSLTLQNIFFRTTFPLFIAVDMVDAVMRRGACVEFVLKKLP